MAIEAHATRGQDHEVVGCGSLQSATPPIAPYEGAVLVIGICAATRGKTQKTAGHIFSASGHGGEVTTGGIGKPSPHGGCNTGALVHQATAPKGEVARGLLSHAPRNSLVRA